MIQGTNPVSARPRALDSCDLGHAIACGESSRGGPPFGSQFRPEILVIGRNGRGALTRAGQPAKNPPNSELY